MTAALSLVFGGVVTAAHADELVPTPVGNNIEVRPTDPNGNKGIYLGFSTVLEAGVTSVTTSTTGPAPVGFTLALDTPYFFYPETTAVTSGPITVCIQHSDIDVPDQMFSRDMIWQIVNGQWQTLDYPPGTYCGEAASLDGPFAVGGTLKGDTPIGTNVVVTPSGYPGGVGSIPTAFFDTVTVAGITTVAYAPSQPTPVGFDLRSSYYNFATTAEFSGQVYFCVDQMDLRFWDGYFPPDLRAMEAASLLRMYQFESGVWRDITSSQGTSTCGRTTSFEPVVLGQPPAGITPVGSRVSLAPSGQNATSPPVRVEFDTVTAAGNTAVTESAIGPASTIFDTVITPAFLELSTTATFTGRVLVCVQYAESLYADGNRLFHFEGGRWKEIALGNEEGILCGYAAGLGTFTIGLPRAGSTPIGADVRVDLYTPEYPYAALTFDSITSDGITSSALTTTGPTPSGFTTMTDPPVYLNLETTAGYGGSILVCLSFDTSTMTDEQALDQHLYHFVDGAWQDITSQRSYGRVCGTTSSLSPFVVGEPLRAPSLAPAPTPSVTGTPQVGFQLTAVPGRWGPGTVDLSYQWKRNGAAIVGATGLKFQLSGADAGESVSVSVTGTKAGYSATTRSSTPVLIAIGVLDETPVPEIVGTTTVGKTLGLSTGAWRPAPVDLAVQWSRNGAPVVAATTSTYELTAADLGGTITVTVTGTKVGYGAISTTSAATVPVEPGKLIGPIPSISGVAKVGQQLVAVPGVWTPTASLNYQWFRGGTPVSGATAATYALTSMDRNYRMTVTVTATLTGYLSVVKKSAATPKVT
ncbi:hypothetical protein E3T39_02470 [Cryobacterium suzukii]|uniref:Ig-like domain-containing protein n=1 Tax=Cryobacterium suzukii TaxID=1259198 RepID=A0A4R9AJ65_9MICO|nr:hypothetical protein [Cryobacterium suzukii]TFD62809.1 hypothetical protein E3T39_02470 [Cryobacterium suzukii]